MMGDKWEGGGDQPGEHVEEPVESSPAETWEKPAEPAPEASWTAQPADAPAATPTDAPAADTPQQFAELSPELKKAQAQHAWEGHGENEFKEIGIQDVNELETHIANVRNNPDRSFETRPGVPCYGKLDGEGAAGTIVIDNPMDAKNGGTAFRSKNMEKRMDRLVYTPENDQ